MALTLFKRAPQQAELGLQLTLQALWRGDWTQFSRLVEEVAAVPDAFIRGLLSGDSSSALAALQAWNGLRRPTKKRSLELPPLCMGFYCLALLAGGDPQHFPALKQAIGLGLKEHYGRAYPALSMLLEQLQGSSQGLDQGLRGTLAFNGFDGLLLALVVYWSDAEEGRLPGWQKLLEAFQRQLSADGYHWLAAEVEALLAEQAGHPWQAPQWYVSARAGAAGQALSATGRVAACADRPGVA